MRKVQQHNLEFDMGRHTFSMGINEYSDLVRNINVLIDQIKRLNFVTYFNTLIMSECFILLNWPDMG